MNRIELTGRISNDLEVKRTPTNKSILEFDLAVKRDRKNESGTYLADFIRIVCWEQKAEFLSTYAQKGTMIGITGKLETSSYEKDGKKIYKTFVTADGVEILSQVQKEQNYGQQTLTGDGRDVRGFAEPFSPKIEIEDDELPFY